MDTANPNQPGAPETARPAKVVDLARAADQLGTTSGETSSEMPTYWLGLEEYYQDPAFRKMAENEFLSSPLKEDDGNDGFARREFLKLMGASIALATAGCIRRPLQNIIPYAQTPLEITPGEANFYTSTWFDGSEGYGILVKTLEGRPIKLEGNPRHPMNKGALPARAHAEVLSLYDPDRLKGPQRNLVNKTRTNKETINATWETADQVVIEQLKKGPVVLLTNTLPSPSSQAIIADFFKAFPGRHVVWDSFPNEALREAARITYGRAVIPSYRFDRAKMVVSVDADFLGTYLSPAEFSKQFSAARRPGAEMSRLVSFESGVSLTGLNADDRLRIKPSQQIDVVLGLLYEVGVNLAQSSLVTGARNRTYLESYRDVTGRLGIDPALFKKVAAQLWENRGRSLVVAGGLTTQTTDALDLQIAVNILNSVLQNEGKTIDAENAYNYSQGSGAEMQKLIDEMTAGKVQTLIIHGVNPVYSFPDQAGLQAALAKVPMVISTANWNDESASTADYVLPSGTSLESWGDAELQDGLWSIQQPTIRPLHNTRSLEESLHKWADIKSQATWYDYVRNTWRTQVFPKAGNGRSFEDFWVEVLQNGVVDLASARRLDTVGARSVNSESLNIKPRTRQEGLELSLYSSIQFGDGHYANVSWLQELPDPVTKIVWDNYAMLSPATAKAESISEGDIIVLTVGQKSVEVPVHIQPGMHDQVVSLAVGYGRSRAGRVGNGIGVNAFALATFAGGTATYAGLTASYKKTGKRYDLVTTQGHHSLEGRNHVVEATLASFTKNPSAGIHNHHIFSIWPQHQYNQHKWAMSIDLNSCTGCSACVIACQSENNVPTVGKKYVMQGREMHWIRIDRYYKGSPEAPEAVFQPMLCQHCESAPCETVCPVLATVHNEEGLNDMIYNRCVGTRYCSNNCPYKVRRFNWFNYEKREAPLHMALNPDVTVRSRGVMEKCSFCVQRIRHGTNAARDRKEPLKDGAIKTACQETCPTDAIVFGDLNNPESAVAKLFKNERAYSVLEELNALPRIRYQTRIRNADRVEQHEGNHA